MVRHRERSLASSPRRETGLAAIGRPRPMRSRVSTIDGRSPGSRVLAKRRLPGFPVTMLASRSPLTVAGAAAVFHRVPYYSSKEEPSGTDINAASQGRNIQIMTVEFFVSLVQCQTSAMRGSRFLPMMAMPAPGPSRHRQTDSCWGAAVRSPGRTRRLIFIPPPAGIFVAPQAG